MRFRPWQSKEWRTPPPLLGADTVAVLRDVLGYDPQHIDDLLTVGAVEKRSD